jgi:hypothetical protein
VRSAAGVGATRRLLWLASPRIVLKLLFSMSHLLPLHTIRHRRALSWGPTYFFELKMKILAPGTPAKRVCPKVRARKCAQAVTHAPTWRRLFSPHVQGHDPRSSQHMATDGQSRAAGASPSKQPPNLQSVIIDLRKHYDKMTLVDSKGILKVSTV